MCTLLLILVFANRWRLLNCQMEQMHSALRRCFFVMDLFGELWSMNAQIHVHVFSDYNLKTSNEETTK